MEKKFYRKEEVLKTVLRDRRWDEVVMLMGGEKGPVFDWKRMADMVVWSQDDECYKVVTYPIDDDGLFRKDVEIMDWEHAIGGYAIETALTDGCHGSPYESLRDLYTHVCNDIDVRENEELRDTLIDYLTYLMKATGYGHYSIEKQEENLRKCKKLWDWKRNDDEEQGD